MMVMCLLPWKPPPCWLSSCGLRVYCWGLVAGYVNSICHWWLDCVSESSSIPHFSLLQQTKMFALPTWGSHFWNAVPVFARLSQPSQPVKCSEVALICFNNKQRRQAGQTVNKYGLQDFLGFLSSWWLLYTPVTNSNSRTIFFFFCVKKRMLLPTPDAMQERIKKLQW